MDDAKAKARVGAPDRWAIVAESMTGGRGTGGNTWHAPPGGLYLSFVLRGLQDPHLLTLALGNAVADALEVAGAEPRLKWVNDVLVGGKKIAGILVEGESTGDRFDFLVAGIGININGSAARFPPELRPVATTLEDVLACDSCIPDLETLLLQRVDRWLGKLADGRDGDIVAAFRARDALAGRRIRVESGRQRTEGVAAGIDEQGHLLVRVGAATQALSNGTVTLLG
jgi:BirA family biotin operon repressor/biotin-[acetyl-CoA-carboxylase] ligase